MTLTLTRAAARPLRAVARLGRRLALVVVVVVAWDLTSWLLDSRSLPRIEAIALAALTAVGVGVPAGRG